MAVDIATYFGPAKSFPTIGSFVNVLLKNILVIAGIVAFFAVIVAGIQVIATAGDAKAQESSKGAFTAAVIGLIIIFGAYAIVTILGQIIGFDILSPAVPTL